MILMVERVPEADLKKSWLEASGLIWDKTTLRSVLKIKESGRVLRRFCASEGA